MFRTRGKIEKIRARTEAQLAEAQAAVKNEHQAQLNLVKQRRAALDLAELEQHAATVAAAGEVEREKIRDAARQRRRDNARCRWEEFRDRLVTKLAGRSILVLVAMAVVTAWVGQFNYLLIDRNVILPFAVTGASALELTGIALMHKLHIANKYRDRAVRIRLLMWSTIAFAAWANYSHFGPVMAAMSVLGPLVWEVSEWWSRRHALYLTGDVPRRPVRPRFALDRWLMYPRETWRALRVAVRDDITNPRIALTVARAERGRRDFLENDLRTWQHTVATAVTTLTHQVDVATTASTDYLTIVTDLAAAVSGRIAELAETEPPVPARTESDVDEEVEQAEQSDTDQLAAELRGMSKKAALICAFTTLGRRDIPAALKWLAEHGLEVDRSYAYTVKWSPLRSVAGGEQ
jgi:uncharacterized protein DUF2637